MADMLTIQEQFGRLRGIVIGYIGDGNNVLHSLAQAAGRLGARVHVATPVEPVPLAPEVVGLHTSLNAALDPTGRLNPGRDPARR